MNKPIASVTYLPPCLCHHRGKGYDITTGKYVNPITRRAPSPVFMQVGGRWREVKPQWRWLFRPIAKLQRRMERKEDQR